MNHVGISILSEKAIAWVTRTDSLSDALQHFTHNAIEFKLIQHDWEMPAQTHWRREICFALNNIVWITAITRIPKKTWEANDGELSRINATPIGKILFRDPTLSRSKFIFHVDENNKIVTRQSTFYFRGNPLDVTENFYPEFFDAL